MASIVGTDMRVRDDIPYNLWMDEMHLDPEEWEGFTVHVLDYEDTILLTWPDGGEELETQTYFCRLEGSHDFGCWLPEYALIPIQVPMPCMFDKEVKYDSVHKTIRERPDRPEIRRVR